MMRSMTRQALGSFTRRMTSSLQWPALLGLVLVALSATFLVLAKRIDAPSVAAPGASTRPAQASVELPGLGLQSPYVVLPPEEHHLEDVARALGSLTGQGVQAGKITYGRDENISLDVAIRSIDVQLTGAYADVRQSLLKLGSGAPHGFIESLRIERPSHDSPIVVVNLKYALVYVRN